MRAQGSAKPTCPALAPRDTLHPRRRVVLSHVRYARVSMGTGLKQRADSLSLDRESLPTCLTMESRPLQTIQRLGPLVSCMTNPCLHQEDTLAAVPWVMRDDSVPRTWSALSLQARFRGRLSRAPAPQQDLQKTLRMHSLLVAAFRIAFREIPVRPSKATKSGGVRGGVFAPHHPL
jgi:hypothetical protein